MEVSMSCVCVELLVPKTVRSDRGRSVSRDITVTNIWCQRMVLTLVHDLLALAVSQDH